MTDLTRDQVHRLKQKRDGASDAIARRLKQIEDGEIADHKVNIAYEDAALKASSAGVAYVYEGATRDARERFKQSAHLYRQTAAAEREQPAYSTNYRRLPFTLVNALYRFALAGELDETQQVASKIQRLNPKLGVEEVDSEITFQPDKYYFAVCLAGAVLEVCDETMLEKLEEINEDKPETDQFYGQAILDSARGIARADCELIESGLGAAIAYHDRQRHTDNPFESIMSIEATALYIIVSQKGYNPDIDSEFIPKDLVTASLDG